MAKATVITKSGTKITLEGTPDELAILVARFEDAGEPSSTAKENRRSTKRPSGSSKASITSLICDLIDGGFFKKPKELSAVKVALEEQGHFYPTTTLSPALLRLVRGRTIRRIKQDKRWMYVG